MSIKSLNSIGLVINKTQALGVAGAVKSFALLNIEQQKLFLTTKSLTASRKDAILTASALTETESGLLATTSGLTLEEGKQIIATSADSAAKKKATVSTISLSGAYKGLATSIGITTTALSLWLTGIAAVSIALIALRKHQKEQEELMQATANAAQAYSDSAKSIDDYTQRYQELHKALIDAKGDEEQTHSIKQQLLELQKELNDTFGDEYKHINLVTDAYKDQTEALRTYNKEKAEEYLRENRKGNEQAEEELNSKHDYIIGSNLSFNGSDIDEDELNRLISKYQKRGLAKIDNFDPFTNSKDGTFMLKVTADPKQAKAVLGDFMDELDGLSDKYKGDSFLDKILNGSSGAYTSAKEDLSNYSNQYNAMLEAEIQKSDDLFDSYQQVQEAVKAYNDALVDGDDSKIQSAYRTLANIREEIGNDSGWDRYRDYMDSVFDEADTRILDFRQKITSDVLDPAVSGFLESLQGKTITDLSSSVDDGILDNFDLFRELVKDSELSVDELIDELVRMGIVVDDTVHKSETMYESFSKLEMIGAINDLSEGFESLDKIMSSIKDKNPFDYALLDDSKFKENFSELGDAYTDFIEIVSNSPNDIESCQSAFDDLVTEWLNSSDVLKNVSESTAELTISMLENMGIANAEEVVYGALNQRMAENEAQAYLTANASFDLANATANEINEFYAAAEAAGFSREALFELQLAKIAANSVSVVTDGDIQNLIALAEAANIASVAVANAKNAAAQKTQPGVVRSAGAENAINNSIATNLVGSMRSDFYKPKINYGGGRKTNSGSGGKGSKGGKGANSKEKEDTTYDWIETRLKRIDERIEKLKKKISETLSYKSNNHATDTVIDSMIEKLNIYNDTYNRYIERANMSGLSSIYIDKIQNGTLEIEDITDETVKKAIDDYTEWYNKAVEVQKQIDETKESVRELNIQKLDNIINDFEALNSLMEKYTSYRKKLIDLSKRQGEEIYESDYEDLIADQNAIYQNLEDEYEQLQKQLNALIAAGDIKKYSEDWYKYQEELANIKGEMLDCTDAIEDFKDAIIELRFKPLEDFANLISHINSEISTMSDLIGSDGLVKNGMITDKGITQLALYGKQLANAKKQAAEYKEAIKAVTEMYNNGDITLDEYNERIREYQSAQWDAAEATKAARDAILNLRYEAIQQEIDAFDELIQKRKDDLAAQRETDDYQKTIAEKQKNITSLQNKIDTLSNSTARSDQALKLQLEKELADARQDLQETQSEHEYNNKVETLEKEGAAYSDAKNKEIEELKNDLTKQDALIESYLSKVKDNYNVVYKQLTEYGETFNMDMTENLTEPWSSAESATQEFKDAVTDAISQINYEISQIDTSKLNELIDLMNQLGNSGNGNSGSNWMDDYSNTTSGTWKKDDKGWWYDNGDGSYTTNDFQKINGKMYSFDSEGYMQTEWQQTANGDWAYFDVNDGHAVTSTWIQGKTKDDWYYIDHTGIMASDAYVKAKDKNGYYFVGSDGLWDGELETNPDLKRYPEAYRKGTISAKAGVALVDEEGYGSEIMLTEDGILRNMAGGETIFNKRQKDFLYSLSNNPAKYIYNALSKYKKVSDVPPPNNFGVQVNGNMVNIEGSADQKTIQAAQDMIRRELAELPRKIMIDNRKF